MTEHVFNSESKVYKIMFLQNFHLTRLTLCVFFLLVQLPMNALGFDEVDLWLEEKGKRDLRLQSSVEIQQLMDRKFDLRFQGVRFELNNSFGYAFVNTSEVAMTELIVVIANSAESKYTIHGDIQTDGIQISPSSEQTSLDAIIGIKRKQEIVIDGKVFWETSSETLGVQLQALRFPIKSETLLNLKSELNLRFVENGNKITLMIRCASLMCDEIKQSVREMDRE